MSRAGGIRAVVVADGAVPRRADLDAAWPSWMDGVSLVIAADGGWDKAVSIGLRPDLLVGDGDSLPEARFAELAAAGVPIERAAPDKDESDAELALLAALRRGASHVTVLGALGGQRFDHALANVGLLALPDAAAAQVDLLDATTRVRLMRAGAGGSAGSGGTGGAAGAAGEAEPATCPLPGAIGDLVSLLPLGAASVGVTTRGLKYPLNDETLPPGPARGLSNVRIAAEAGVKLRRGSLLIIETRTGLSNSEEAS